MLVRAHKRAGLIADPFGPVRQRFKNTPTPPPAPDPVQVANAQTGTNIGTSVAQATLNNTNQVTPYGSTDYKQTGGYTDPTTGQWVPQFTQTTSLTPLAQSILTGTENTANSLLPTGQALANEAATSATTPLNFNSTNNSTVQAGPQALDPTVANAAYNASTAFLTPTFTQQQTDLQDQLARQGISVGTDAYGNAERQLQNSQNSALTAAANNAVVTGADQANKMFGLALQGQGQNVQQQLLAQQNPISLLSQLYGAGSPVSAGTGVG